MKNLFVIATAAALLLGQPMLAADAVDQATQDKVTALLTAQGYDVRQITTEDGLIEVYAVKDGKKYEVSLDAALEVVDTKDANG